VASCSLTYSLTGEYNAVLGGFDTTSESIVA